MRAGLGSARRRSTSMFLLAIVLSAALGATTAPAATADPTPEVEAAATYGPFPSAGWFLWVAHTEVLGRPPTSSWLQSAGGTLATGGPAAVYEQLLAGAEYREVVAPVIRLYKAYFLRRPDAPGLLYWIRTRQAGTPLNTVSDLFAASPEFRARYGEVDDGGFVDLVYTNVLGRLPDEDGRAYWVGRLGGGLTRGELLVGFAGSSEFRAANDAWVDVVALYVLLLRRAPDPSGFDYWVERRRAGGDVGSLAAAIIAGDEYRARWAGPFPPAPAPTLRIAVFGDSVLDEVDDSLRRRLQTGGRAQVDLRSYPGSAICNWYDQMTRVRDTWRPHIVVLSFIGNTLTQCMSGAESGEAFARRQREDSARATAIVGAGGAWVYWISPPAMRDRDMGPVVAAYEALAAADPARVATIPTAPVLSPDGAWVERLPCRAVERCDADGTVRVRSPDGVHFCPELTIDQCPVASPGAERYAAAVVDAIAARFPVG